jgi:FeS assembly protein IscX
MALKWTDTLDIAIALDETYPDADPRRVNFVDLSKWVQVPAGFRRRPRPYRREDSRGHSDGLAGRAGRITPRRSARAA